MTDAHALERTSPKGGPFVGRCTKCGKTGLTFADQDTEECANPGGMTQDDALLEAIEGEAASPLGGQVQALDEPISSIISIGGGGGREEVRGSSNE